MSTKPSKMKEPKIEEETPDVDYDELLSSAGELGRYQIQLFFATCPFYMFGVFSYFQQMFITEIPQNHWCRIPELEHLTVEERISFAIPPDKNSKFGIAQCYAYIANWTEVLANGLVPNSTWKSAPCQYGWEFDRNEIPYETISTELEWVCEKGSYQAVAQSVFFFGSIFGGLLFGWMADRYGRLPAAITSNVIAGIGGIASIFTTNVVQFSVTRFIVGMGYDNCMMMAYLIVLEYVAPKYRSLFSNLAFSIFYSVFATALPWLALICGHWKTISLVTSIPMALAILAPIFISESPRWLLSKGRVDEAIDKILVIGRTNKKEVPEKLIEQFKLTLYRQEKEEEKSWLEIFKRPMTRRMFILICLEYMCCNIVFDGLIRSIGQLNFNFFASFSLVSATEFPSLMLLAFVLDWSGRRWLSAIVMFISCIFSILTVFMSTGLASVMCAVIARFAVNMSYSTAMQWAAELLPTSVRGSGGSIVHICGFIATVLSPYIVYLNVYIYWLPAIIIGATAALGGFIAIALPETAKKAIPHTFDDAEELGRQQKFWDLPFLRNKGKSKSVDGKVNVSFEM